MEIKIKPLKNSLKRLGSRVWKNTLVLLFLVIVIYIIAGGILFHSYYLQAQKQEPSFRFSVIQVNQQVLDEFSKTWQARAEQLEEQKTKKYRNLFHPSI